jgi:hypothetical protein
MSPARRAIGAIGLAAVAVAAGGAAAAGQPADAPPVLACSADPPVVAFGGSVVVRAWAAPDHGDRGILWDSPVGQLTPRGAEAQWDLAGLRPGTYAAVARIGDAPEGASECVVRVVMRPDPAARGPGQGPDRGPRETGWAILTPSQKEEPGYGLYSYLLLGGPPTEASRPRYLAAIDAYLRLSPAIQSLEQYLDPKALNIAYLPVQSAPPAGASAEWMLERHDYARSRVLLREFPGEHRGGPYIVSALQPVAIPGARGGATIQRFLFQDLSWVPAHLASAWTKEFLNQAAQERFWEPRTAERLALRLRLTIAVLGAGLPEVRKALDSWIAWTR